MSLPLLFEFLPSADHVCRLSIRAPMLRSFGRNRQTKAPPEAGIIPVQAPEAQEPGDKQIHKAEEGAQSSVL